MILNQEASPVWSSEDTARLTAAFRSIEMERERPLLVDPWSPLLAGDKGYQLVQRFPGQADSATGSIIRSLLVDEILEKLIGDGACDHVLCVGAGYDTRPYRLALPSNFRWTEFDLPDLIQRKTRLLDAVKPNCRVDRFDGQLFTPQFLQKILAESRRVAVIMEGFLIYQHRELVDQIARTLTKCPNIECWVTDLASSFMRRQFNLETQRNPKLNGINWRFAPEDPAISFRELGWEIRQTFSCLYKSRLLNRAIVDIEAARDLEARDVNPNLLSTVVVMRPGAVSHEQNLNYSMHHTF